MAGPGMHMWVHLDLKGSPPSVDYLLKLIPLLREWGTTGLLIEWEDMLPWYGRLSMVASPDAYSREAVKAILEAAALAGMEVVPLVQTFGHMEAILKHPEFKSFREEPHNYMDLCPLAPGVPDLIRELIRQVKSFHPDAQRIHVGCDEVFGIASCARCISKVSSTGGTTDQLFLDHVDLVIAAVEAEGARPMIWHDMLGHCPVEQLKRAAGRTEVVVWSYGLQVDDGVADGMWERLAASGAKIWGASAFRGASRPNAVWVPTARHVANHVSWLELAARKDVPTLAGMIITGWARFNHTAALCETLPVSLPCLALCLAVLQERGFSTGIQRRIFDQLGLPELTVAPSSSALATLPVGAFPGAALFQVTGRLEVVRQRIERHEENARLFCPPYTHRINPPMWLRLQEDITRTRLLLEAQMTPLYETASAVLLPSGAEELVAGKAKVMMDDLDRMRDTLTDLISSLERGTLAIKDGRLLTSLGAGPGDPRGSGGGGGGGLSSADAHDGGGAEEMEEVAIGARAQELPKAVAACGGMVIPTTSTTTPLGTRVPAVAPTTTTASTSGPLVSLPPPPLAGSPPGPSSGWAPPL